METREPSLDRLLALIGVYSDGAECAPGLPFPSEALTTRV